MAEIIAFFSVPYIGHITEDMKQTPVLSSYNSWQTLAVPVTYIGHVTKDIHQTLVLSINKSLQQLKTETNARLDGFDTGVLGWCGRMYEDFG